MFYASNKLISIPNFYSYPAVLQRFLGTRYRVRNFGKDGITAEKESKTFSRFIKTVINRTFSST